MKDVGNREAYLQLQEEHKILKQELDNTKAEMNAVKKKYKSQFDEANQLKKVGVVFV